MILSSLVSQDPGGFVNLDKNLARHLGAANVDAFHEAAGNLVVDEMLDNPRIRRELLRDESVMAELGKAVHSVRIKAFGLPAHEQQSMAAVKRSISATTGARSNPVMRDMVQGELLTNGVINDRTMRNSKVMAVLKDGVEELFEKHKRSAKRKKAAKKKARKR